MSRRNSEPVRKIGNAGEEVRRIQKRPKHPPKDNTSKKKIIPADAPMKYGPEIIQR